MVNALNLHDAGELILCMQEDMKSGSYLGQCFVGFWYEHICATVVSHVMALTARKNYTQFQHTQLQHSL